ncbi:hypothetical protein DUF58 [Psychromonas ingrahamii 37]|uniref:DUF58 domain-containing protein n=1 Tax=Psychromonas ingrahamii (strain DSM 17664 / CCUG 51855 / 37) TaxID=357804 RepID=A1SYF4_PSYIN|nr:DUF58 domain-containing protein [Psychromonas ingrahamii]ABM04519.1 hypothetical protein DUF58 [Psychromonas ingrahamii 37]
MTNLKAKNALFNDSPYQTGIDVSLSELLCYKKQAKIQLRPANSAAYKPLSGNYLAKIKGRGMEFAEVRHYQAGDDIRSIDWSVTARTGKAHTKLFQEEKERPVFILLDLSDSMIFGSQFVFKSVQACHLAALLSWQAKQRNDRLGGIVFNQQQVAELKPTGRNTGLMAFLHQSAQLCASRPFKAELQSQSQSQSQSLLVQLKRLSYLVQTGSQVHLISDFSQLDEQCQKLISQIRRHNQINAWQVSDPLELALPNSVQQDNLKINSLQGSGFFKQKKSLQDYQKAASQRQHKVAKLFTKQGIPLYQISAARSLLDQFHVSAK